ncbi:MGH1-like glycoside hydrolase domain-containing protein [Flavobacterium sp.]|uniref:alpha-L-rhamnosidase-related protein n=1 Tax=Flavobacterium sp. TaxID=239 RepID=UPI0039E62116
MWATAAWEVYKATGDQKWLESTYEIIKNSVDDDYWMAFDDETNLMRGESSFLDWREQTYPKWMQPADIFESQNLGTNAVHYQANMVLSKMARALGHEAIAAKHERTAESIKKGINDHLWITDKGYYGQYLYGRNYKMLSPRAEALGEALCILFGIADAEKAASIVAQSPQLAYGIPCIYPQIPGLPPYHNDAVWPFVQSYWALASAKAGNEASAMESIAAIYRPAALFLTNKENFVAGNGDFAGTVINSSNMLWSLSGNIALVHKLLFGIELQADRLVFHPFVPKPLAGQRRLNNFKYRNAILDISLSGYGNQIKKFTVDGKKAQTEILASLTGKHKIDIVLNNDLKPSSINKTENYFSLPTPLVTLENNKISWASIPNAVAYAVIQNGKIVARITANAYDIAMGNYAEYQVVAIDKSNMASFASEPIAVFKPESAHIYEAEDFAPKANYDYKGFSGTGFVETAKSSKGQSEPMRFTIDVAQSGTYAIDFRYANGNGPTNTENKCAIRDLSLGNSNLGTFVFPQRGVQEWSNWGFSNSVKVHLPEGKQALQLDWQENMNGAINQAMIDYLRIIKLD